MFYAGNFNSSATYIHEAILSVGQEKEYVANVCTWKMDHFHPELRLHIPVQVFCVLLLGRIGLKCFFCRRTEHRSMRMLTTRLLLAKRSSVCMCVFFTLSTDRASTIPSKIRGYQTGTWSKGSDEHLQSYNESEKQKNKAKTI